MDFFDCFQLSNSENTLQTLLPDLLVVVPIVYLQPEKKNTQKNHQFLFNSMIYHKTESTNKTKKKSIHE